MHEEMSKGTEELKAGSISPDFILVKTVRLSHVEKIMVGFLKDTW